MIPANDDAVGSIEYLTAVVAKSYREGREKYEKDNAAGKEKSAPVEKSDAPDTKNTAENEKGPQEEAATATVKKKKIAKKDSKTS